MKFYLAPMEGITGYVYRNAWHEYFGPADKYFTPFITTNQNHTMRTKELKDVLPEHNQGLNVIPQVLTNNAGDFVLTAVKLEALGYREVNLNLGCPSGTVAAKKKGSGFLAYPDELKQFFEDVCSALDGQSRIAVSVKTRLGKDQPEEFVRLLEIYNQYPLAELIVHPRVQTDFYKNTPNLEMFRLAVAESRHPLCYNGNIFTKTDYDVFCTAFPQIERIMCGRGVIANPALPEQLRNPAAAGMPKERLKAFHDRLYYGYLEDMRGDERNTLFRMKELWSYLGEQFADSGKAVKQIKKARTGAAYLEAVTQLFG